MIVAHTGAQRSVKWRKAPLYWRRMAVLAHAGLITNALFHAYPDAPTFMSWAGSQGGMTLILGTIRDRRQAPHWHVMSTAAVRAMVVERAYIAVASVPADRRPPEWASLTEAAMKDGGDLIDAFFPGPLSDFEGYVPPLPREDFAETMEDLRRRAPPGELRVFSLFVNAVPLDADDLTVVEGYVKALDVARPEEQAACVTTLGIAAGAAAAYRHVGLAEAIRDKVVALFPHVDGNRRRELLGTLLDASNAYELAKAGWPWAARAFERLGHGATNQGELAALATVMHTLRRVDPESGPYFASVDAIVRLRWPHLP
jgi:hypothetical protein